MNKWWIVVINILEKTKEIWSFESVAKVEEEKKRILNSNHTIIAYIYILRVPQMFLSPCWNRAENAHTLWMLT